jgi:hypothetical protein
VGTWGPQPGVGRLAAVDWWLGSTRVLLEETVAAAAPANTTDMAKMRMASFMIGNPLGIWIDRKSNSCTLEIVEDKPK